MIAKKTHFSTCLLVLSLLVACSSNPRRELAKRGFDFTEKAFIEQVQSGKADEVRLFLRAGMNVDARSQQYQRTALHVALHNKDVEMTQLLVKNGASLSEYDQFRKDGFYYAAEWGNLELFMFLTQHSDAYPNRGEENGVTPMMAAAYKGHANIVGYYLSELKMDPNHRNKAGGTALMNAAYNGHTEICRMLIRANADINLQVDNGYTALHFAAESGQMETIQFLVEQGALTELTTDDGKSAAELAREMGHERVYRYLIANIRE